MDVQDLENALATSLPRELARDIAREFGELRRDTATRRLGGSSPGKFVETLVQILQFLDSGEYEHHPDVDKFLRALESRPSSVPDGLRICAARVARAMYSLRSKRNIVHKGEVDPNTYDLQLLHAAAQWVLAELVRTSAQVPMQDAGLLIEQIQTPVGGLVEDVGGRNLVLAKLTVRDEVLVLLQSHHPAPVSLGQIVASMDRRDPSGVRRTVRTLWKERKLSGEAKGGFKLTELGLREAMTVVVSETEGR